MRFQQFVFKNVARRPVRSSLTVLGMSIAVAAVVALVGISQGFVSSFLATYQYRQIDLVVQQAGAQQQTSTLPESLKGKIEAIPGVKRVNSGIVEILSLPELSSFGMTILQGWPPDSAHFEEVTMLEGDRLRDGDRRKAILGRVLATNLGKKVGDTITLFENEEFQIKGIYESVTVYENGGIAVLLKDLQELTGKQGQVTGFTVVLDRTGDPAEIQRVRNAIEKLGPKVLATPVTDFVKNNNMLKLVEAMAWVTSAVALIIGTVGVLNTMVMSVFERTREIGILRAIGWARRRIVRMILLESVILSLAGGIIGTLFAVLLTMLLSRVPAVAGVIDNRIPPTVILQGIGIGLLAGLIGAAYPAYRGAQLLPTEAIRHE